MPGAIDFQCSVACAASREERLSEKIAMRMDGLPRWMREGMAAQGYTSFVACQRARAVPKKKGRLGSRPLQLPKIWVYAEATRRPNGPLRKAGPTTAARIGTGVSGSDGDDFRFARGFLWYGG